MDSAVAALAALAQENRLAIFRLLVQTGEQGMSAGALANALKFPNSSLSFHLAQLLKAGLVHGDAPNVYGRSLAQVASAVVETPGQQVVVPIETPLKPTGGLAILRGNLSPEGSVVKLAGH